MMARLLVAILACSLGCCSSSSSCSSAVGHSCETEGQSLGLLQRQAKSSEVTRDAHVTQGRTASVAIIKAYNDSQCTNPTGAMMNVSLSADACFLGWTFNCTCVGNSKALVGKKYERLDCQSGPSKEHIIPVGTCADGNVTIESSDVFEIADDLGSCPSCAEPSGGVELEEMAKETRPMIVPGGGRTIGDMGPYKGFGYPFIAEYMFLGPGCMGGYPMETFVIPANIGGPFVTVVSSSSTDIRPNTLEPVGRGFGMVYLGFEFDCSCRGRKKGLDVFEYEALNYARFMDEPIDPTFFFTDGGCFDFPAIDGGEIIISIFTDASECPPCKGDGKPEKPGKPGSCTICGDPHVTVFDETEVALLGTTVSMDRESSRRTADVNDEFGWGDFWLVKSSEVSIQARYRKVYYPNANQPLNNTYLTSMAVGGPFMRGHRLIVEPRSGTVAWVHPDGSSMELFPSDETSGSGEEKEKFLFEHGDLIKASYFQRTAIDKDHGVVQGLDVQLPSGVGLIIDRFGKHLDLRIEMPASAGGEGGLDGQCGNFNGDATDDTTDLLEQRIGYQVPTDELLFI